MPTGILTAPSPPLLSTEEHPSDHLPLLAELEIVLDLEESGIRPFKASLTEEEATNLSYHTQESTSLYGRKFVGDRKSRDSLIGRADRVGETNRRMFGF